MCRFGYIKFFACVERLSMFVICRGFSYGKSIIQYLASQIVNEISLRHFSFILRFQVHLFNSIGFQKKFASIIPGGEGAHIYGCLCGHKQCLVMPMAWTLLSFPIENKNVRAIEQSKRHIKKEFRLVPVAFLHRCHTFTVYTIQSSIVRPIDMSE